MREMIAFVLVFFTGYAAVASGVFDEATAAFSKKDFSRSLELCRPAAEKGNADCQNLLGDMYRGGVGVKQDYAEAVKWYGKAAEQDLAEAQNSLGILYHDGRGLKQDFEEALTWFHKAAEQEAPKARSRVTRSASESW